MSEGKKCSWLCCQGCASGSMLAADLSAHLELRREESCFVAHPEALG